MHLQNSAQSLARTLGRVEHRGALVDRTGIDAEEAELADIGVGCDFERESGERCRIVSGTELLLVGLGVNAVNALLVKRGRHIIHDRVQQLLNALVLIRCAADNGDHLYGDGRLADGCADLVLRDFLSRQIQLHDLIVLFGDRFEKLLMILLSEITEILGNFFLADILAQLIIEDVCLHLDEVDHTAEVCLRADRQLDGNSVTFQPIMHHFENIVEVRTHDIHLIHIDHARDIVLIRLTPDRFGLRLNAALGTKNGDRAVEYAQGALDLYGEVHMTRGVDDIDAAVTPKTGRSSGRNRDAAFLLLLHPVHRCRTLVGLAQLIGASGIEQDALGRRGLAGVNMRHDTDISCILK